MKKYIQLTPDRKKAHWKWEYDETKQIAIENMFEPSVAALMVDITGIDPEPQEGWLFDGEKFEPPAIVIPIKNTVDDIEIRVKAIEDEIKKIKIDIEALKVK